MQEVTTYLSSGEESLRLYREVLTRIRSKRRRDMLLTGFFAYIHLPAVLVGLVLLNVGASNSVARIVSAVLICLISRGVVNGYRYCVSNDVRRATVVTVLKDYSRTNAYEILQRALTDASRYGHVIVNTIQGQIKTSAGGYLTVTSSAVFRCADKQCGHMWGMIVDYPVWGKTRHYMYCPKCSMLAVHTLDGAQLPEGLVPPHLRHDAPQLTGTEFLDSGDASLPLLPLSVREPYAS